MAKRTPKAVSMRIEFHSAGFRELLNSVGVRADLTRRAEQVRAAVQTDSRFDSADYDPGLHIIHKATDRAVVRVGLSDPIAHLMEARHGFLSRAMDSAR